MIRRRPPPRTQLTDQDVRMSSGYAAGPGEQGQFTGDLTSGGVDRRGTWFNVLTNVPTFLKEALNLRNQDVPNRLRMPDIAPYVEATANGWGLAAYRSVAFTAVAIPAILTVIAPDPKREFVTRIMAFSLASFTVVGAHRFIIRITEPSGAVGSMLATPILDVAPNDVKGAADIFDGFPAIIPPGHGLDVIVVAGAATFTLDAIFAELPAGFAAAL